MPTPLHRFDRTHNEDPAHGAHPDNRGCNKKYPIEMPRPVEQESRNPGRDGAREIPDKILYSRPATDHFLPRQSLGIAQMLQEDIP